MLGPFLLSLFSVGGGKVKDACSESLNHLKDKASWDISNFFTGAQAENKFS